MSKQFLVPCSASKFSNSVIMSQANSEVKTDSSEKGLSISNQNKGEYNETTPTETSVEDTQLAESVTVSASRDKGESEQAPTSADIEQLEMRRSGRKQAETLAATIKHRIEDISKYHESVMLEIKAPTLPEFSRLSELHIELKSQTALKEIIAEYEKLRSLVPNSEGDEPLHQSLLTKSTVTAVDRVTEDNRNLTYQIERLLDKQTTRSKSVIEVKSKGRQSSLTKSHRSHGSLRSRPKSTRTTDGKAPAVASSLKGLDDSMLTTSQAPRLHTDSHEPSQADAPHDDVVEITTDHNAKKRQSTHSKKGYSVPSRHSETPSTITSYMTGTSRSHRSSRSSSSRIKQLAIQSKLDLAEAESKVKTEMDTIHMEEELQELERQKERVKRSMRAARAQGELEAQRKRHQILLEAVEEEVNEDQTSHLLSKPDSSIRVIKHPEVSIPMESKTTDCTSADRRLTQATSAMQGDSIRQLAQELSNSVKQTKKIIIHPKVFDGNPLKFREWEVDFNVFIDGQGITGEERLRYLRNYVEGEAKECISGQLWLNTEAAYDDARQRLRERFGKTFDIARHIRNELSNWKPIPKGVSGHKAFIKYSDYLRHCMHAMHDIKDLHVLNDSYENEKLAQKLPPYTQRKWANIVLTTKKAEMRYPTFREFAQFVESEAELLSEPIYQQIDISTTTGKSQTKALAHARIPNRSSRHTFFTGRNERQSDNKGTWCTYCEIPGHEIPVCRKFRVLPYSKRAEYVEKNSLCYKCLNKGHMSKGCINKKQCQQCLKEHPTSMHSDTPIQPKKIQCSTQAAPVNHSVAAAPPRKEIAEGTPKNANQSAVIKASTTHTTQHNTKALQTNWSMTVPVYVSKDDEPEKELLVYALLDSQSDTTYMTTKLANQLMMHRVGAELHVTTLTGKNSELKSDH